MLLYYTTLLYFTIYLLYYILLYYIFVSPSTSLTLSLVIWGFQKPNLVRLLSFLLTSAIYVLQFLPNQLRNINRGFFSLCLLSLPQFYNPLDNSFRFLLFYLRGCNFSDTYWWDSLQVVSCQFREKEHVPLFQHTCLFSPQKGTLLLLFYIVSQFSA